MTQPQQPIPFTGDKQSDRLPSAVSIPPDLVKQIAAVCPTSLHDEDRAEHGRDWWPLAMHWALNGSTVTTPDAVCRPRTTEEVVAVVALCARAGVAVTAMGGRSGVSGASIPVRGGIALDTTGLEGVVSVDEESGIVCVGPGTFGPDLEEVLRREHGMTVGHFPQSFALSTVGGWVAGNGAGQYSTRYGAIGDMVAGLEIVCADSTVLTISPSPSASAGPDLVALFVGSEGTLGIVTKVWLRCHPVPDHESRATYSFSSFNAGISAMRDAIRNGATPAVLRLYDEIESARSHGGDGTTCTLLALDEGHVQLVDATFAVLKEVVAKHGGKAHDEDRVALWLEHRNDTGGLQALTHKGFIVDTMEVAAPWSALPDVARAVKTAAGTIDGIRVASCHQSHSYLDGGCLYFTFVAKPNSQTCEDIEERYVELWDAAQRAALAAGATVSHHHGVGLNRARFLREALGPGLDVWSTIKRALDPQGILNPGKLGDTDLAWP